MQTRAIAGLVVLLLMTSTSVGFADVAPAAVLTQVAVKKHSRATAFIVAGALLSAAGLVITSVWRALADKTRDDYELEEFIGGSATPIFATTGCVAFGIGLPLLSLGLAEKIAERPAGTVNLTVQF